MRGGRIEAALGQEPTFQVAEFRCKAGAQHVIFKRPRLHARLASPGGSATGGHLANLLGARSCARMRVLNEDLMIAIRELDAKRLDLSQPCR